MKKYIVTSDVALLGRSKMLKRGTTFDEGDYRRRDVERQLAFGTIAIQKKPAKAKKKSDDEKVK